MSEKNTGAVVVPVDRTYVMVGELAELRRCYLCGLPTRCGLQLGDTSSGLAIGLCDPHVAIVAKHLTDYLAWPAAHGERVDVGR